MEFTELPGGVLMYPVPVYQQDWPVMALAVNKQKRKDGRYEGIVREITSREGNVGVSGFLDRSKLFIVESKDLLSWKRKRELKIKGINLVVKKLQRSGMDFIGLEDPDIWVENKTTHLYFTIAFKLSAQKSYAVFLGHAQGRDLSNLTATMPVMSPKFKDGKFSFGFKEAAISPVKNKSGRINLVEGGHGIEESTIESAFAKDLGKEWHHLKRVADPCTSKFDWVAGDYSPAFILPPEMIKKKNLLVAIINGRTKARFESGRKIYGDFTVGLALFNPKTGELPWISPHPLIKDPEAKKITFASDYFPLNKKEIILYAHVDDSFVRAYEIRKNVLEEFIGKFS